MCCFLILFLVFCFLLKVGSKLSCGYCRSYSSLVGKTAIVTGASSGIGYHTALGLASRGCKVIIASRTCDEELKNKIIKQTNNPSIIAKKLDVSSYESVRAFAKDIQATEERLDILVNNAGTGFISNSNRTKDQVPTLIKLNHLGPFLLTHLLADLLKKSAPSRIIFVSSLLAFTHKIQDDVNKFWENLKNKSAMYSNTKLLNIITSDGLAKRLEKYGVTSNSCHPGVVNTEIFEKSLKGNIIYKILLIFPGRIVMKTPYEGAQTSLHLAVSNKLQKITGRFFCDCVPFWKPKATENQKLCEFIWKESEMLVKLKPEEELK